MAALTPAQIEARAVHLIDQETAGPKRRYWLSFCDPDAQPGGSFLGVCIVEAHGFVTASVEAHRLGCNPGGEVCAFPLDDTLTLDLADMNRLLTRRQAEALNGRLEAQIDAR